METIEAIQLINKTAKQIKQLISVKAPTLLKILNRKVFGISDNKEEFDQALIEIYELLAEHEEDLINDCSLESERIKETKENMEIPYWVPDGYEQSFISAVTGTATECKTKTEDHGILNKEKADKIKEAKEIIKEEKKPKILKSIKDIKVTTKEKKH